MKPTSTAPISPAQISWQEDGTPKSIQFQDVYFSKHNGIEETRFVFLETNQLETRLKAATTDETPQFCIGETGFGTGLNFLCAWQLRNKVAPTCHLHFMSVEKFPLTQEDLATALTQWPELETLSDQLIQLYPTLTPGWHRVSFIKENVDLSLFIGDVIDGFSSTDANIDAWFLDGFAPAKNPDMWSEALFENLARLSRPGTTLSTFTAAGIVRNGLQQAGFEVERVKGFAHKRHMVRGVFPNNSSEITSSSETKSQTPWFLSPKLSINKKHAIVIGGGLAGTSAAYSLARRGWKITLYEQHEKLAHEASGNQQGVLYNKVSAEPSLKSDFYTAGYLYSLQLLRQLLPSNSDTPANWQACGVMQLSYSEEEHLRQLNLLQKNPQPQELVYPVTAEQASKIAGITLSKGGLFFPGGGWAKPSSLCEQHVQHPNIKLQTNTKITRLEHINGEWHLFKANSDTTNEPSLIDKAQIVIIANANAVGQFNQTDFLPVKPIRGQTTHVPASNNASLTTVICGRAYIAPSINNQYHMGATFNLKSHNTDCTQEDHTANINNITEMAPSLAQSLNLQNLEQQEITGRVGFRASSPDYMPLVGPVPDIHAFIDDYASLRKDANLPQDKNGAYLPGLYVTTGHGSKGLTTCPLAGEILAAYLNKEAYPIANDLINAVNPARFLIRDLKRNKI